MAEFQDLSPWQFGAAGADHVLAVGWLEADTTFATGQTPREVFDRLQVFASNPWQPFASMGRHPCGLCQFEGEKAGAENLFIPFQGKIYVCPELITHYINAHHYQPPSIFCEAVMACPAMDSMEYKRLLIACNGRVLWETHGTTAPLSES